ncbi:MAG TPA: hypothetical protein VJ227_01975 [Patescibacteria group bacterium]|nr:hypothetical protein [Patescibacteria group bacterium]
MITISGPVQLIKKSFAVFFKKENFVYFLKIYLIFLPAAVLSWAYNPSRGSVEAFLIANPVYILLVLLFTLIYLFLAFWVAISVIIAMQRAVDGGELSYKNTYSTAWKYLGKYALLQIVIGPIIVIGFTLLIIPGLMFLIWFSFAGFELVTKGKGVRASISGSRNLVKGRFWAVSGRFIVFGLFNILVQIIFSLVPFGIGGVISTLFGGLMMLPAYLLYKELTAQ